MKNIIKIPKKQFTRLQLGIFIVVLACVFIGLYFFFRPATDDSWANTPTPSEQSQKIDTLFQQADELASNGSYEKGMKILDDALASSTNDTGKAEIYTNKSSLASNASHLEDAFNFAMKAETLHPTRATAIRVAVSAEELENLATALKYYKLVVERTTESQRKLATYDNYYENKVKELSE